jgi:DNA topoisomerase IB
LDSLLPAADSRSLTAPEASAKASGLRYSSDASPGLQRQRVGKGFTYVTEAGVLAFLWQALPGARHGVRAAAASA